MQKGGRKWNSESYPTPLLTSLSLEKGPSTFWNILSILLSPPSPYISCGSPQHKQFQAAYGPPVTDSARGMGVCCNNPCDLTLSVPWRLSSGVSLISWCTHTSPRNDLKYAPDFYSFTFTNYWKFMTRFKRYVILSIGSIIRKGCIPTVNVGEVNTLPLPQANIKRLSTPQYGTSSQRGGLLIIWLNHNLGLTHHTKVHSPGLCKCSVLCFIHC